MVRDLLKRLLLWVSELFFWPCSGDPNAISLQRDNNPQYHKLRRKKSRNMSVSIFTLPLHEIHQFKLLNKMLPHVVVSDIKISKEKIINETSQTIVLAQGIFFQLPFPPLIPLRSISVLTKTL